MKCTVMYTLNMFMVFFFALTTVCMFTTYAINLEFTTLLSKVAENGPRACAAHKKCCLSTLEEKFQGRCRKRRRKKETLHKRAKQSEDRVLKSLTAE